jgi:hypothetical protein
MLLDLNLLLEYVQCLLLQKCDQCYLKQGMKKIVLFKFILVIWDTNLEFEFGAKNGRENIRSHTGLNYLSKTQSNATS